MFGLTIPSSAEVSWLKMRCVSSQVKTLGIGDGANDVAMIQAADIGVGIAGKEGRQAVNNSDFAVGQFKFLVRLLMVHGQLSHYRLGRLIKFSFFKNITFAFVLVYYQFFCGFSGEFSTSVCIYSSQGLSILPTSQMETE